MPTSWRSQAYFILGFFLLAVYFLIPTLGHFDRIREEREQKGEDAPFYLKLFPRDQIKLGLDLRGGIYAEVEVETEEALHNRRDLLADELQRFLQKESFVPESVQRPPDSQWIQVTLKKEEDRNSFLTWIRQNYQNVLHEDESKREGRNLFFILSEDFEDKTKDQTVRQALETIRNRIDRYGVSEPTIVRLGTNRISIELPGMTDPDRALNLIKQSGRLEFRLVDETKTDEDIRKLVSEVQTTGEDFSEDTVKRINEALKGKIPADDEILFEVQYDPVTHRIVGGIPYLVKRKAPVSGEMLKNAQVDIQNNEPYVSLTFNQLGTSLFAELTKQNIGKRLAIVLDGKVSKAPVIKSEIPNGQAQITLGFGDYTVLLKEAEDLTLVLREGALPARVRELSKTVVGPSLGQDSIRRGIQVSLVAGLLVMLFMAVYYRLSGVLADIALALNILLMMAALAIFQATLTLPGIAGIVLTIGMAVDANVLIFERMREETRAGKSARSVLTEGYKNASTAILDANITTFLAGVVLYQFGTGPIRGFAVTLMIGITTTLFTALIVTKVLQKMVLYGLKRERLSI